MVSQNPHPSSSSSSPLSPRKLRANRRNARKSTGPRSPEGKQRSAENARSHGIFCRDAILPGESHDAFEIVRQSFIRKFSPQDLVEFSIVERISLATWRLTRCNAAENLFLATLGDHSTELARKQVQQLKDEYDPDNEETQNDRGLMKRLKLLELAAEIELPGDILFTVAINDPNQPLDRYGRYEQRLQQTIHRCMRQLNELRGERSRADGADFPPSPFAGAMPSIASIASIASLADLAAARIGDVDDADDADDADERNDQNNAPECPQMPDENAPAQNEPTAPSSAASPVPPGTCAGSDDADPNPDGAEPIARAIHAVVHDLIQLREDAVLEDQEE